MSTTSNRTFRRQPAGRRPAPPVPPPPTASSGSSCRWCFLPLATPISDAKVLTGRQKPLTEIAFLFAEIETRDGHSGIGFSYSKRAGGPGQYAHAKEIAPNLIGEDPERHRAAVGQAGLGRRLGGPQRPGDAGDRRRSTSRCGT